MELYNIYEKIYNLDYDKTIERNGYVILKKQQIIPKYYLMSNDINVLIINYSTGSGKTLCGIYLILNVIKYVNLMMINHKLINKPYVIGEWTTQNQFKKELKREMFHLGKKPEKLVNFYGYQGLFNSVFPHYFTSKIQDINVLINDFKNNKLDVNYSFLETLRNNIIVVDEIQNLYSNNSLNTYGFTLSYLAKISKEYNIKILLMTGTLFNSSLNEISAILNLVSPNKVFYSSDDFIDISKNTIFTNKTKEVIDLIKNNFIYYNSSTEEKHYKLIKKNNLSCYNYVPNNQNYPEEFKYGNKVIDENLIIYELNLHGEQLKEFKTISNVSDDDDNENKLSINDAVLPKNVSKENGIYDGDFLLEKNIINYSAVGYELLQLIKNVYKNNEKIVVYHNKIRNFGLLQYGKILDKNGYLMYGKEPKKNTICRHCGKTYGEHNNKTCHFVPVYYHYLIGEQKEKEREFIVNNIYNNPNNLYGDLITILLISDVAYAGVSLLSTNNLVILSRVSNLAKIEQIQSRIRRFNSHRKLPKNKRFVNFYILGIPGSYEYYKYRSDLYKEVNKFMKNLINNCVGETLLNKPKLYNFDKKEKELVNNLFYNDAKQLIETSIYYLNKNTNNSLWNLDTYINRIKDNKLSISCLDFSIFSNEFIKHILYNNNLLQLITFKNIVGEPVFVKIVNDNETNTNELSLNTLSFSEINKDYDKTIKGYLEVLKKEKSNVKKRAYYYRLLDLLESLNDFNYLKNNDFIFDLTFDYFNEYYDNDETEFIKNHSSKHRNINKVSGLYWKNKIVLKNGSYKTINYSFSNNSVSYNNSGYSFSVVSDIGLRLMVFNYNKLSVKDVDDETDKNIDVVDSRNKLKGNDCWNYKDKGFIELFKVDFNKAKNSQEFCGKLMVFLCDESLKSTKSDIVFIKTPYER